MTTILTLKRSAKIAALLALLSACSNNPFLAAMGIDAQGPGVSKTKGSAWAYVTYKHPNTLHAEAIHRADNGAWSESRKKAELDRISKGGTLTIKIKGHTIESANTRWWEFVVYSPDGKEALRTSGSNNIPEYTTSEYGTTWWNYQIIDLPELYNGTFRLLVVDNLSTQHAEFTINPGAGEEK